MARALAMGQAVLLLVVAAGSHGWIVGGVRPNTTDYVSFYAAGRLADRGTPALAYDEAAHRAEEVRVTEPGIGREYFFYPPTFLLLCAPLAWLPYLASFLLFEAATLALWLGACLRIAGRGALWPLLACGPVWWTIGLGQNAFLSAGIVAAATLLLPRRPAAGGALLGLLCFKPHFALLVPVALAVRGEWRAFAAAAAMLAACVGASLALFGVESWRRFLAHERGAADTLYGGAIQMAGHVEARGAALLAGVPPVIAIAIGAAALLGATICVAWVWRRGAYPMRAAALAAGMVAAAPFALFYDLLLASVAGAWFARAGEGFLPWEKTGLAFCVLASILAYPLALATHVPLGALIAPVLLTMAVRRAAA